MLSYNFTLTNIYTGESITLSPCLTFDDSASSGYGIILQEYPTFVSAIKNQEIDKSGQHGVWDSFSFYGGKRINFSGKIKYPTLTEIIQKENLLKRILSLPPQPVKNVHDGYVKLSWVDIEGNAWYMNVKIDQDVLFSRTMSQRAYADFTLDLKAEDPYIYSDTLYQETGLLGWRQGMAFPMIFVPIGVNILYNNMLQLYQTGNVESPAIYRLSGYAENPRILRLDEEASSESTISDFLTTDNWVGGTEDAVHVLSGSSSLKLTSTNNVVDTATLTEAFDLDFDPAFQNTLFVNYFDSLTEDGTIAGQGDADNLTVDYSEKTEGNASIKFDVDVSKSVSNYAGITTSNMNPKDIRGYEEGFLEVDVYISDISDVNSVRIDIGSNSGANGQYKDETSQFDGAVFVSGWNTIRTELLGMTRYGTGADYSSLTYTGIRINYSSGKADMTDCRVDNFKAIASIKRQWISFFVYIDSVDNIAIGDSTVGTNYIKFSENVGVDEFIMQFSEVNKTLRDGWNYIRILKDQFDVVGNPSWEDIVQTEIKIKSKTGTTLNISFDKLRVKNVIFNESELKLNITLQSGEYVDIDTQNGTITKNDSTDLSAYLDGDSTWFGLRPGENSFMYESDYNPLVTWIYPTQRVDIFWRDTNI